LEAVPNSAVVEEAVHAACSRSNTPINWNWGFWIG
jgi:hypothetical protein